MTPWLYYQTVFAGDEPCEATYNFSLSDELCRIELRHDTLQDLIPY